MLYFIWGGSKCFSCNFKSCSRCKCQRSGLNWQCKYIFHFKESHSILEKRVNSKKKKSKRRTGFTRGGGEEEKGTQGRREGVKVIRILLDSKGKQAEVVSLQEFSYWVFFLLYAVLNVYRRRKMEKTGIVAWWKDGGQGRKNFPQSPCDSNRCESRMRSRRQRVLRAHRVPVSIFALCDIEAFFWFAQWSEPSSCGND